MVIYQWCMWDLAGEEPAASGSRSLSALLDLPVDETGDGEVADHDSPIVHSEKKRRLSAEQVRSLEMSFELENKLEPERKLQLANELGLQPRQVAIWFQNRRARWKTKQLERDYDILKAAYDTLLSEKENLQAEIVSLNVKLQAGKNLESRHGVEDYRPDGADDQSGSGVALKSAKGSYLSEDLAREQPGESDREQRSLPSPMSSYDAFSDSNGASSPLANSRDQERPQGLTAACSSSSIEVGFDHKSLFSLPAVKFDIGDPAHHLSVAAREEPFGTVCDPHSCEHLIYKQLEKYGCHEEEPYNSHFFNTLADESGCWPWYWDCLFSNQDRNNDG